MKYNFILFDLDGTLFDYDMAELNAFKYTLRDFNIDYKIFYLNSYREINKQLWEQFEKGSISQKALKLKRFSELAERHDMTFDPQQFSKTYLYNLSLETALIDGTQTIVNNLAKKYELYLITNGLSEVQRPRIARSEIGALFRDVIISEEVGSAKPDREIFDIAFRKMNNPPKERVLIVGDSLTSDMAGGWNYGIDTCWFNPGEIKNPYHFKATYEIRNLIDLFSILE